MTQAQTASQVGTEAQEWWHHASAGHPFEVASHTYRALENGEWMDAALGTALTTAQIAGTVMDPVGAAAKAGAAWVLDHIGPLEVLLDEVAGDEAVVRSVAAGLRTVGNQIAAGVTDLTRSSAGHWSGVAAGAHGEAQANLLQEEAELGASLRASAAAVDQLATMVSTVHGWIKALIAEVVVEAARNAALVVVTAGVATPAAVAHVAARVSVAAGRAAGWIRQIASSVARLERLLDEVLSAVQRLGLGRRSPYVPQHRGRSVSEEALERLVDRRPSGEQWRFEAARAVGRATSWWSEWGTAHLTQEEA